MEQRSGVVSLQRTGRVSLRVNRQFPTSVKGFSFTPFAITEVFSIISHKFRVRGGLTGRAGPRAGVLSARAPRCTQWLPRFSLGIYWGRAEDPGEETQPLSLEGF